MVEQLQRVQRPTVRPRRPSSGTTPPPKSPQEGSPSPQPPTPTSCVEGELEDEFDVLRTPVVRVRTGCGAVEVVRVVVREEQERVVVQESEFVLVEAVWVEVRRGRLLPPVQQRAVLPRSVM